MVENIIRSAKNEWNISACCSVSMRMANIKSNLWYGADAIREQLEQMRGLYQHIT